MANEFGAMLRRLRELADVSLGQLARFLEFTTPYLSDVERGRRSPLSDEKIKVAARLLRLTPTQEDELLASAGASRGFFELPVTHQGNVKNALGAALARGWPDIEEAAAERLLQSLNQELGK